MGPGLVGYNFEGPARASASARLRLSTMLATVTFASMRSATLPLSASSVTMQLGMSGGDLEGGKDDARNADVRALKSIFYREEAQPPVCDAGL
jgi:hypothetical protein